MGLSELKEVQKFFKLSEEAAAIKRRISELREEFYSQTMETQTVPMDMQIVAKGFDCEKNVIPFVDSIMDYEKQLMNIHKKQRYLNDYLQTLEPEEKRYLIEQYTRDRLPIAAQKADINLYEEIMEITEAVNFMNGIPPDIEVEVNLNNDKLEDSFSMITTLLDEMG